LQVNRQLIDGGYWVDLPFMPSSFVYQVAIIDVAKIYAAAMVPNLNGATPAALDVVLFKLPTGKNGSSDRGQCRSSAHRHRDKSILEPRREASGAERDECTWLTA
jgi:hypothetical protein